VQSVVVTGVSTGIGWGIAKVMTAKGFRVFGSVRKQADADRLKAELGERFSSLLFDVTDEAAVGRGAAEVRAALTANGFGASSTMLVSRWRDHCWKARPKNSATSSRSTW
jgi:NAD(P)-dependent dehydrogenase (short-subunit alcohol dehydrogenase family)